MSLKKFIYYGKKILLSQWLCLIIRFALGSIFVYAGFTKLLNPKAFAKIISLYDLVPEGLLVPVAIGLPVIELIAGLGLIFAIRGSLTIIFGLLIMFIAVLWYGILSNLDIDCGCFSPEELDENKSLWHAFYRDIMMVCAAIYIYVSNKMRNLNKSILS